MKNIICVTNRLLCKEDFIQKIGEIARTEVEAIILREKDLDEKDYEQLYKACQIVVTPYNKPLIMHSHVSLAERLGVKSIHLSIPLLRMYGEQLKCFDTIGVSVHSVEEAVEAYQKGATYLIAGHIFETKCKEGIIPRGLVFVRSICNAVTIPVYGIGGVNQINLKELVENGAKGGCIMSGLMK